MSAPEPTAAQAAYRAALADVLAVAEQLKADGAEDRLAGLVTAVDLGTSAAFLFSLSDRAYGDATNVIRGAIAQATRKDDS